MDALHAEEGAKQQLDILAFLTDALEIYRAEHPDVHPVHYAVVMVRLAGAMAYGNLSKAEFLAGISAAWDAMVRAFVEDDAAGVPRGNVGG